MVPRRTSWPRRWTWILGSLFVTTTALVPLAYVTFPHVHRWRVLSQLDSEDQQDRRRAQAYVLRYAVEDERVLRAAVRALQRADHRGVLELLYVFDQAGLVEDERVIAAVTSHLDEPDDERFAALLGAMDVAGLWRRPPVPDGPWLRWLGVMAADANVEARIFAARELGRLYDIANEEPVVAMLEALIADAHEDVRLHALLASAELAGAAQAREVPATVLEQIVFIATSDEQPALAREAWLLLGLLQPEHGFVARWKDQEPAVAAAIVWAVWRGSSSRQTAAAEQVLEEDAADGFVRTIAQLILNHTAQPQSLSPLDHTFDEVVGMSLEQDQRPLFRSLFASEDATVRDLACFSLALQLDTQTLEPIVGDLLVDYNPYARMAGAMLSGLAGVQGELLQQRSRLQSRWDIQQVMRLGLWMQGRAVTDNGQTLDMRQMASAMLITPRDVPPTSVLLAMLHRRDTAALEYLLAPWSHPPTDLGQLLVEQRWHRVLRHYLPDDAPRVDEHDDPAAVAFQVDTLRHWYLVNRHRLRRDWPAGDSPP